jgi:hypothetical protein
MVIFQRAALQGLCCLAALVVGRGFAVADQLDRRLVGAWALSPSDCSTLFERSGGGWKYRSPVDQFAQAAIIRPGEILMPAAACQVLSVSHTKDGVGMTLQCNDSVSVQTQTATVKIQGAGQILYSPTGDPSLGTTLTRCP